MVLAAMTAASEDDVICDFAETYHVLNYRGLPLRLAATLACGLRDDSRIRQKLAGVGYTREQLMLAAVSDATRLLVWMQTTNGKRGINRPQSMVEALMRKPEEKPVAFDSVEAFERRRQEIINGN